MNLLLTIIHHAFFAMIPAVGFGLLFNVPLKALKYCAAGGAIGVVCRYLLLEQGVSIELATLLATSVVGFLGVYWSQRFLAHPKVFTVAAVIPMLPGVFAFRSMIALVQMNQLGYSPELLANLVDNLLKAVFIVGGLAIGLALPGLLFYRRRSVI
ncbi:threonine/serine exporter family protein [Ferrimonas lipolytica]|uniref:Threonine/Serine exporter ThrE domain-containing protein n=1 Tax=Ferrimonas lipolytica TaxID=2724191 RepID=A0A6H1UEU5_9GAMM|nr:threonine/serine exporter family protein [Ferrimonas lipolytica]QIZ77615.1 hypothetical protein HER31_12360 [Ferrimonas lipolytica]